MTDSTRTPPRAASLERLLVRAALDPALRTQLLDHRETLLAADDLDLSPSEVRILRGLSRPQLAGAVDRLTVPSPSRRGFIRAVPATLVTALAAPGLATLSGCPAGDANDDANPNTYEFNSCDGSRPDPPTCETNVAGGDYWIQLGGRTAFLHLPVSYEQNTLLPLCLAFHGERQSCLNAVDLWRDAADRHNFLLLAIEWRGRPTDIGPTLSALAYLREELEWTYCVRYTEEIFTGVGLGGTLALTAALGSPTAPASHKAASFGGPLQDGWQITALEAPLQTRLYISMAADDKTAKTVQRDAQLLRDQGVRVQLVVQNPSVEPRPDGPDLAWRWLG